MLVSYGDTENHKPDPEPIQEALQRLGIAATPESLYIGDDVGDIEAAYHAGVTSVAVRWGPASIFELSSSAPDIFMSKASTLLRRERLGGRGYIGETLTSGWPFHSHWGSILHCDDDPTVYALGRYFTASDPRHATSALSAAVLSLKNNDTHAKILGEAFGKAIANLDWEPDYVVPVPMKPSQQRNCFEHLLNEAVNYFDEDIELELKGLRCVKEIEGYKQMNALERADAIKGAFQSNFKWNGNKISSRRRRLYDRRNHRGMRADAHRQRGWRSQDHDPCKRPTRLFAEGLSCLRAIDENPNQLDDQRQILGLLWISDTARTPKTSNAAARRPAPCSCTNTC